MNTITYSSNDMNNLWNYLQGLPISIPDRRWLANRLLESTKNEEMRLESEANGNSELSLDEINEEIRQARLERKKRKMVEA